MNDFEEVLSHYGIKGQVVAINQGPLIKQIVFLPEVGTKVKNIEVVLDDVARELGYSSLRVDAIEGSSNLGFEIPQDEFKTVDFKNMLLNTDAQRGDLPVCMGADVLGNPVFADLAKMPHLLVGGTTGSGKSVGLNTFILSLMAMKKPNELKFVLIDPKRIEFSVYNNQKYMLFPVVTETEKAVATIAYLVDEMERRYCLLEKTFTRNIKDYNNQNGVKKLPYIVCVIDEFADLMATDKKVEKNVQRLAQKARACGIHLILATQRPSVDVVTGVLKANFPTRLAYKVASSADSRTIIDIGGAENLIGRGDALFLSGDGKLQRIHGAFIADDDIKVLLEPYRAEVAPLKLSIDEKDIDEEKISDKPKKQSWFKQFVNFWSSLRKKDKKIILDFLLYIVALVVGKPKKK